MIKTQRVTIAPPEFQNQSGEILATVLTYLADDKSELYRNERVELKTQIKIASNYGRAGGDSRWILNLFRGEA